MRLRRHPGPPSLASLRGGVFLKKAGAMTRSSFFFFKYIRIYNILKVHITTCVLLNNGNIKQSN